MAFLVLQGLTEVRIIMNRYFEDGFLNILKKHHRFLYHILFSGFSNLALDNVSLEMPLMAHEIGNAELY